MTTNNRHERILSRLNHDGRVTVDALAEELEISAVTIRRDLERLAETGVLRRVRGGAVGVTPASQSMPFAVRKLATPQLKEHMAAAAARMIEDGEAVAIGSGTVCFEVSRALAGRRITVMPFSVQAAAALFGHAGTQLVLPGGWVRADEGALLGPLAEASVHSSRFDTTILSPYAVSVSSGVTAQDFQEAAVEKSLIEGSQRTILVADGSKFSRSGIASVCDLTSIDVLITDASAPPETLEELRRRGVLVRNV